MQSDRWRAAAVAMALVGAGHPAAADDVVGAAAPAPRRDARREGGIDLAAHVDINVVLPPHHWRVAGGLNNLVIAGGGRLVVDGNLTIGGETVADPAERIRKADEAVLAKLRQAQRERLAAVAGRGDLTAAQRRALELATEADIRRVLVDVAHLRARYADQRANLGDEGWQRFQKDIALCRRAIDDPFGDDSLVAAVRAGFDAGGR